MEQLTKSWKHHRPKEMLLVAVPRRAPPPQELAAVSISWVSSSSWAVPMALLQVVLLPFPSQVLPPPWFDFRLVGALPHRLVLSIPRCHLLNMDWNQSFWRPHCQCLQLVASFPSHLGHSETRRYQTLSSSLVWCWRQPKQHFQVVLPLNL